MEKKLKSWQGWLLFGGTMAVVFVLGVLAASINERRAEIASVMNNKKVEITGIESVNEKFAPNYPREYETWTQTMDTSFQSKYNGNQMCWQPVPKWLFFGPDMLFLKIIQLHAVICMRLTICVIPCVSALR